MASEKFDFEAVLEHPLFTTPSRFAQRCDAKGFKITTDESMRWTINGKPDPKQFRMLHAKMGHNYLALMKIGEGEPGSRGCLINGRYTATVAPEPDGWKWHLMNFVAKGDTDPSITKSVGKAVSETTPHLDSMPTWVAGLDLLGGQTRPDQLQSLRNFAVEREGTAVTPQRITLSFSYDCPDPADPTQLLRSHCVAEFDPALDLPLVRWQETLQGGGSRHRREGTNTFVTVDAHTCKVETKHSYSSDTSRPSASGIRSASENTTYKRTVQFGPFPESDFTLEALDIQKPAETGRPRSIFDSLYTWLAGSGGLLLVGAAITHRLMNRWLSTRIDRP